MEGVVSESRQRFDTALESDFNTSLALTEFFNLVKIINGLAADEKITKGIANIALPTIEYMLDILGLNVIKATDEEIVSVFELIQKRDELREKKQFEEADSLRDKISSMGIHLIDHSNNCLLYTSPSPRD